MLKDIRTKNAVKVSVRVVQSELFDISNYYVIELRLRGFCSNLK